MTTPNPAALTPDDWQLLRDHLACWMQTLANGGAIAIPPLGPLTEDELEDHGSEDEMGPKARGRASYDRLDPVYGKLFPGDDPWR